MAVAASSGVNVTPGAGTNTGASPSITTAASNPVMLVTIGYFDSVGGTTVSSLTITGFGGTASLVKSATISGGQDETIEIWVIKAPTANTAGTVQANFSGSVDFKMHVEAYSGADQTVPCPTGDAVSSVSVTAPETLTPANLTANDASHGGSANRANSWDLTNISPNSLYNSSDGTDHDVAAGYATGTAGVAFSVTGGGGTYVKVAVRIVAAAGGGPGLDDRYLVLGEPTIGSASF